MQLATRNQLSSLLYNWDSELGREKDLAVLAVINIEVLRQKRSMCGAFYCNNSEGSALLIEVPPLLLCQEENF